MLSKRESNFLKSMTRLSEKRIMVSKSEIMLSKSKTKLFDIKTLLLKNRRRVLKRNPLVWKSKTEALVLEKELLNCKRMNVTRGNKIGLNHSF